MLENVRRHLSLLIAVLAIVILAASQAVAQPGATKPGAEEPTGVAPAGIAADTVDGKHAVGAGSTVAKRAGKLVATNAQGHLPSNIIKKAVDAD